MISEGNVSARSSSKQVSFPWYYSSGLFALWLQSTHHSASSQWLRSLPHSWPWTLEGTDVTGWGVLTVAFTEHVVSSPP